MAVDIVATAVFMVHKDAIIPSRVVFTCVSDPDLRFIIEPIRNTLMFTYKEVMLNLHQAFSPFHMKRESANCFRVPVEELKTFVKDFYREKFELHCTVGCLDTSTYMYLMPLLPKVEFIGPAPLFLNLHYLGPNQCPIEVGRMAATNIQTTMNRIY